MTNIFDNRIDNETLLMILEIYQKDSMVHQFTCGTCRASNLEPKIDGEDVVLICPRCSYRQIVSDRLRALMGSYMASRS